MTWVGIAVVAAVVLVLMRKITIAVLLVCVIGFICDQTGVDVPTPKVFSGIANDLENNKHTLACNALAQRAVGEDSQTLWDQLQTKCPEILDQSKKTSILDEN